MSSSSSSTMSLTALGTGIDWQSIVSQLTQVSEQELTPYNNEISAYNTQISAWGTISSDLSALQSASNTLASPTALDMYSTNVTSNSSTSASSLLTASASSSAQVGSYNVVINSVAQAQKLGSGQFSSQTNALNLSGTFLVNNQTLSVSSSDTLQTLQSKINGLDSGSNPSGATSAIVQDSPTTYRMVLSSDSTGASGISLSDGDSNNVLEALGFNQTGVTGGTANTTNGATPITASTSLTGISGYNTWTSGDSIAISGKNHSGSTVSSSFAIKQGSTVQDLLNQIDSAFGNVTASVNSNGKIQVVDNATGTSQLSVGLASNIQDGTSTLGFGTFGTVGTLGQSVLQQGTNASFSVDGMNITSASNTVTSVIPGVTLNLLGASSGTTLSLNVSQNVSGIENEVNGMVSAFNNVMSAINTQNTYNSATNTTGGPLFGDSTLQGLKSQLENTVLNQITTSGTYGNLPSIGVTVGANGMLSLNTSTFEQALSADPRGVAKIFQDSGSTSDSNFQYVSNTSSTQSGTYNVALTSSSSGTIDGQAATVNGNSWTLTGSTSGANGLVASYSGSSYPASATLTVNRGIASLLNDLVSTYTNSTTGIIAAQDSGINNSITGLQKQVTNMQSNIDQQTQSLTQEYEAMNTAIAQLDQMQSYLSAQFASLSG